tara:strand:- start:5889 stop:7613 length:1725 start_codon:yes stop_codon:yes gene_type:complete
MTLTKIASTGVEDSLRWVLGANGTSDYTFTGPGLTGTVNDPTIYLTRGHTYIFQNNSGGHPFYIKTSIANGGTNDAYNTGVTNNGGGNGTEIVFTVPHDSPDILYYQCSSHASMAGQFNIAGSVADGSITTAKLAADAVTAAKLADNAVVTANIVDAQITTAKIADGAVTAAKIASQTITADKIASNAVNTPELVASAVSTSKLANNAVTTSKIADSQITTAKINDGAVTTAKINDDAVTNAKLASNCITNSEIAGNSIDGDKIANTSITGVKLVNGAINEARISNGSVTTDKIGDQAVTLAKLPHGTSSNDGKFLRANNGADPTFESIPAGITINNQADNRIITATGTSDTLNSESNLTFALSGSDPILTIQGTSAGHAQLNLNTGGTTDHCGVNFGDSQQTGIGRIQYTNSGDYMILQTNGAERMRIDSSGNVTKPYQPAFAIRNSTNADFTWSNGAAFPFNSAIFNRGSHFNTSNYRFTAPVDGAYQFNFYCIIRYNDHHRTPVFQVNGNNRHIILVSFSWNAGTSYYDYCSFSIVRSLSANDYVTVNNVSGKSITTHGHEYSLFSGFLIG